MSPGRATSLLVPRARAIRHAPAEPATPDSAQAAAVLAKATVRAAEVLKLTGQQLASILGVSEASVSRMRGSAARLAPASNEGQRAVLFLRSFRLVEALLGGNLEQCRAWFRGTNLALRAVPLELMTTIVGMVQVEAYLQGMASQ